MIIELAKKFLNAGSKEKGEILDYYNNNCYNLVAHSRRYKIKPSDEWCAAFVSAVVHMAGIRKGFPFEVSTQQQYKLAKQNETFFTDYRQARAGDLVLFDWDVNGQPNHVGFFVKEEAGQITTLEGNKEGTVGYRVFSSKSRHVLGFVKTPIPQSTPIEHLAIDVIRGVYGYGEVRKKMLGSRYQEVQDLVNVILKK